MANFQLTRDLWTDALHLAGELTDGTSRYGTPQYDGKALEYLNAVNRLLYTGGRLGSVLVLAHDWLWARPWPRLRLNLESAWSGSGTVTLTSGSTTATLDAAPPTGMSLANWRLWVWANSSAGNEEPWTVAVQAHTAGSTTVTLRAAWPYPNGVAGNSGSEQFVFGRVEYLLTTVASDFLRFVGPFWMMGRPGYIPIISAERLQQDFPLLRTSDGLPEAAAIVGASTDSPGIYVVQFSHYLKKMTGLADRRFLSLEFDRIPMPTTLSAGATEEPAVPLPHRRLLSFGAAYYLCLDKSSAKAAIMEREFAQGLSAMVEEHEKIVAGMTEEYGRIPPYAGRRRRLETGGWGLPVD
jgi:hypothetical protein